MQDDAGEYIVTNGVGMVYEDDSGYAIGSWTRFRKFAATCQRIIPKFIRMIGLARIPLA